MTTRVSNSLATLFLVFVWSRWPMGIQIIGHYTSTCNNYNYRNNYKNDNYNNYNALLFIEKITILDYEAKKQGTYIVIFKWQQVSQKSLKHFIPLFETEHTFTLQQ